MQTTAQTHSTLAANIERIAAEAPLVARAKAGDKVAFTQLLKSCRSQLHDSMAFFCRNHELAEDAVQSASIVAWQKLSTQFEGDCAFSTWIHMIAKNCIRFVLREERHYVADPTLEEVAVTSVRPDYLLLAKERVERFEARSETMTDLEKEIFELHYELGLTAKLISLSEVIPVTQVESILKQIRKHLGIGLDVYKRSEDPDYFDYREQAPISMESEMFDDVALDDGYGPDVDEPEWPADLGFGGCDDYDDEE